MSCMFSHYYMHTLHSCSVSDPAVPTRSRRALQVATNEDMQYGHFGNFCSQMRDYYFSPMARREQLDRLFAGTESTATDTLFPPCSSSSTSELVPACTSTIMVCLTNSTAKLAVKFVLPEHVTCPAPTNSSYYLTLSLLRSLIFNLKMVAEVVGCDFAPEFSQPLLSFAPLPLMLCEESTISSSHLAFATATTFSSPDQSQPVVIEELPVTNSDEMVGAMPVQLALEIPVNPVATTPRHYLAKSVLKHTALKTIGEDEECDFADEFLKPLHSPTPLSLISRERLGEPFAAKESIIKASPFAFMRMSNNGSPDKEQQLPTELASDILVNPVATTPRYYLAKSVLKHTALKTITEDEECDFFDEFLKPLHSPTPLSLISREQLGEPFAAKESIIKASPFAFMRMSNNGSPDKEQQLPTELASDILVNPVATTPRYYLAKSVLKHTALKTITEDEECDFFDEFLKPLHSPTPLSLISRERLGEPFAAKESIIKASPFAFMRLCNNGSPDKKQHTTLCENKEQRIQAQAVEQLPTEPVDQQSAIEPSVTLSATRPTVEPVQQPAQKEATGSEPVKQPATKDDWYKQQCASLPNIETWADLPESDKEMSNTAFDFTRVKAGVTEVKKLCHCTWCCRSRAENSKETKKVTKKRYRNGRVSVKVGETEVKKLCHCTWCCRSRAENSKETKKVAKESYRNGRGSWRGDTNRRQRDNHFQRTSGPTLSAQSSQKREYRSH